MAQAVESGNLLNDEKSKSDQWNLLEGEGPRRLYANDSRFFVISDTLGMPEDRQYNFEAYLVTEDGDYELIDSANTLDQLNLDQVEEISIERIIEELMDEERKSPAERLSSGDRYISGIYSDDTNPVNYFPIAPLGALINGGKNGK